MIVGHRRWGREEFSMLEFVPEIKRALHFPNSASACGGVLSTMWIPYIISPTLLITMELGSYSLSVTNGHFFSVRSWNGKIWLDTSRPEGHSHNIAAMRVSGWWVRECRDRQKWACWHLDGCVNETLRGKCWGVPSSYLYVGYCSLLLRAELGAQVGNRGPPRHGAAAAPFRGLFPDDSLGPHDLNPWSYRSKR